MRAEKLFKMDSVEIKSDEELISRDGKFTIEEAYQLFQNVPIEIAIYDIEGRYKYVNKHYIIAEDVRHEIIGKDDTYYFNKVGISLECAEKRNEYFRQAINEKRTIRFTERIYYTQNSKVRYYKRSYQPIFDGRDKNNLSGICLFGSDLTAVIHGQKELKYLAYHDKLTGLKNRDAFYEQLDQILLDLPRDTEKRLTAILFCDLDSFKLVNDSLGHDIGDLVLKEVAARLQDSLRKSDFVFRLGGDEFTVIIRHLRTEYETKTVASKIIKRLSEPYIIRKHRITYLSTSIGIVFIPNEGTDRETLVKKADTAMYDAKRKGKKQYQFFRDDMTEDSIRRLKIENNLQTLVREDIYEKECKILYQPIIEKRTNGDYKIIGSEALLRWSNLELGSVMPDTFIPIAEETNLITPMGDWIFYKTCKDIKPLIQKFDDNFYVSINLSARQLESSDIVQKLKNIIDMVGINPKNIQLELTETSYLTDQMEVVKNIEQLSKLGVKLAIDDFGVGFASLVYLHRVPASAIKIDRSFIKDVCISEKHKQLVKSIIDLGINLKKDVIAEGVEKEEHVTFLGSQNCNKFQGFFFSRPITLEKLTEFAPKKIIRGF